MGRSRRARRLAALCAALTCACACGEPGPIANDPNSSEPPWLAGCQSQRECPSEAMCVNGVCTLPCDFASLSTCSSLNADFVCDTALRACDLPCGVAMACHALGDGYQCLDGHCRVPR